MKIAGWIVLIFGVLALIGALAGGNSPFGPLFWMGMGIALLYFGNKKSDKQDENTNQYNQ